MELVIEHRLQTRDAAQRKPQTGCAFTVDVEDWYQSTIDFDAPISERVEQNVATVLAFLDRRRVRGTFFFQGLVAERFPNLVCEVARCGHEIQSHGHTHRPLYKMDRSGLRQELERARKSVEDASGIQVTAFRAPDFSVLRNNLWALEILAEVGFTVDSSIFPMRTRRYGIKDWPNTPARVALSGNGSITEAPVAVWKMGPMRLPVAGGGYFRMLPRFILESAIRGMLSRGEPVIIYCHPYEFNPGEISEPMPGVSGRLAFQQGLGRLALVRRISELMKVFAFRRMDEVLMSWEEQ